MPADNEIYDRPGDIWWDEHQPLNAIRTALNPARLEYFAPRLRRPGHRPGREGDGRRRLRRRPARRGGRPGSGRL